MSRWFPTATGTRILRALLNTEGLTITELEEKCRINYATAQNALKLLLQDGWASRIQRGHGAKAYIYYNTASGDSLAQLAIELDIGG